MVVLDKKFVFSNCKKYIVEMGWENLWWENMGWENLLGYMFSALFTQHKVAKGQIFTTALRKDILNPVSDKQIMSNLWISI